MSKSQETDRLETQRRIAVMQAWLDGKQIEGNSESDSDPKWLTVDTPEWDWINVDYRVAQPKPREWWLVVGRGGTACYYAHKHKEVAASWAKTEYSSASSYSIVHIREVLEDEQ